MQINLVDMFIFLILGIFVLVFFTLIIPLIRSLKQPCSGTIVGKTRFEGRYILFLENEKGAQTNLITDEETYTETQWGDPYTKKETDRYSLSR